MINWKPVLGASGIAYETLKLAVNQDGQNELVIATHDQGVIAVASLPETLGKLKKSTARRILLFTKSKLAMSMEMVLEFFATPSKPNRANQSQGGGVTGFFFEDGKYPRSRGLLS